mmetsp:Transcript_40509/g.104845  ORF Transcript_40509/g.104845 Transcript_40509/m.104845 type:complete len:231 (-) Transcript_40509:433-1125(-)
MACTCWLQAGRHFTRLYIVREDQTKVRARAPTNGGAAHAREFGGAPQRLQKSCSLCPPLTSAASRSSSRGSLSRPQSRWHPSHSHRSRHCCCGRRSPGCSRRASSPTCSRMCAARSPRLLPAWPEAGPGSTCPRGSCRSTLVSPRGCPQAAHRRHHPSAASLPRSAASAPGQRHHPRASRRTSSSQRPCPPRSPWHGGHSRCTARSWRIRTHRSSDASSMCSAACSAHNW